MGEGADLARGTAGGRLAGERERAVARLRDLAHQQVDVVDHVVHPGTAGVLVEAHGPERGDLAIRIGINLSHALEVGLGHTRELGGLLQRVLGDVGGELLERHVLGLARVALGLAVGAGIAVVGRIYLERMVAAQAVADVGLTALELDVLGDEVLVHRTGRDDVMADVVQHRQVGLRLEDHRVVGELVGAMLEGRQHVHLTPRMGQTTVGDAAPQDGVHLGHVRAPKHEGVGVLDVVIAAHRLVHAEGAHEACHRRSHAVAGVGVDVVGAETGLVQLGSRIAFPDRPLAGAEHADRARAVLLERGLPLLGHDVEGLVPADRGELAVLVVLAATHAQQRLSQAVLAVHDLGQEVALDAVQATVDRRVGVALRGHHTPVLHTHQHRAAGAAEAAGSLVPAYIGTCRRHALRLRDHGDADTGRSRGSRNRIVLDEFASIHAHFMPPLIRDHHRCIHRRSSGPGPSGQDSPQGSSR